MPIIRAYPSTQVIEPTDAFILDREGTGTMYVEGNVFGQSVAVEDEGDLLASAASLLNFVGAGVTATATGSEVTVTIPGAAATSSGAFRVSLANSLVVPINNGYSGNGGYYPLLDTTVFDVASGVTLSLDYGSLPNAPVQQQFYSPSTGYTIPAGMAGIWSFRVQFFLGSGADEAAVFSVGVTHLRSDGTYVDSDDPSGSDIQTLQIANLAPDTGVFDDGQSFQSGPVFYDCLAGDIFLPFLVRAPLSSTVDIVSFSTYFEGHYLGASV